MDQNLILILAVCVVSLIIGVILDNIVHILFGKKEPVHQPVQVEQPPTVLAQPLSAPESTPAEAPSTEQRPAETIQYVDIVRIGRDINRQQLVLRIGDGYYRSVTELSEEQRKKLEPYVEELTRWFKRPAPELVPPLAPPTPASKPAPKQEKDKTKAAASTEKSVAVQVDEILQEMLKNSPLEKRGIFITETAEVGLIIRVGLEKFDSVEAVPYEEVKEIIRAAVAEWGKRSLGR